MLGFIASAAGVDQHHTLHAAGTAGFTGQAVVFVGQRSREGPEEAFQSGTRDHKGAPLWMLAQG